MEYVIEMNHITKQFGDFKANDDITPVSYTHLDVYKRQWAYLMYPYANP